jgi:hypothetical protein
MKSGKIKKLRNFKTLVLLCGILLAVGFADEKPIPWKFGGYHNVSELHLKYWALSKETISDLQNVQKGSLSSEICELWYSQNPPRLRVDRYIEEGLIKCTQFKGREWEKINHEGKTYVLKERVIQQNSKRTTYYLENISSGGGVELCEYKKDETTKNPLASVRDGLLLLTIIPYIAEPESEELAASSLEMDELLDPEKYKKTVNELKKRHEKAGRQTAKWETGHGFINYPSEGFAFIDLEWGIGLEGFLTGQRGGGGFQAVTLKEPLCIYKALILETKISDPQVFNKGLD